MKFLLTNDDGIEAPGLAALERAMASTGECTVLAPDRHLSGCAHQTTMDRALTVASLAQSRHALDGTPVDCVRLALGHIVPDVDWVISGINEGANLGADIYRSGTVAAVREAALLGKPGIAFSQYRRRDSAANWDRAARWTADVVRLLLAKSAETGVYWNVNFPDPLSPDVSPEIVFCEMDPHPLPAGYRLVEGRYRYAVDYHGRPRSRSHDVDVCFAGAISITRLALPPIVIE
jgi:5'-nucleotidase